MIASIHGTLEARRADQAIVRVGGFSLRIFAPASTLSRLGDPGSTVTLYTHFQVREDGMALYGFSAEAERDAFEQLISISGVGPKVALALLGTMDAQVLYKAIGDEDLQRLSLAPGVGKKLASRLVLELKGKLPALGGVAGPGMAAASGSIQAEVLEVLINLGYSTAEAQAALRRIPQDQPMTLEEQVTFALRSFARE
ncbi:MAG TPA: Holliday junction branch migration protein RuvA [Ktedonobacteraceae bacterium]|jgi:Holliday junction DNA helicase RuvA|nr:Holliday junction branch migration protein RuvA [Ktedonobacteraceae bacterium]